MAVCQNLVPLVNIKIAGKWMFIPLKMVLIGIDPYPYANYIRFRLHLQVASTGVRQRQGGPWSETFHRQDLGILGEFRPNKQGTYHQENWVY